MAWRVYVTEVEGGFQAWRTDDSNNFLPVGPVRSTIGEAEADARAYSGGGAPPRVQPPPGTTIPPGNVAVGTDPAQLALEQLKQQQYWILQLMEQLGYGPENLKWDANGNLVFGGTTAGGGDVYEYLAGKKPDLIQALRDSGWNIGDGEGQMKAKDAIKKWWEEVAPEGGGGKNNITDYAKGLGWSDTGTTTTGGVNKTLAGKRLDLDILSQGQGNQRAWAQIMSGLSGPQDWIKYQTLNSLAPEKDFNSPLDLFRRGSAFGSLQGAPSWEQKMYEWVQGQKPLGGAPTPGAPPSGTPSVLAPQMPTPFYAPPGQQGQPAYQSPLEPVAPSGVAATSGGVQSGAAGMGATGQPAPWWMSPEWQRQPISIGAQEYAKMMPTQRAQQAGLWQAQGISSDDAWDQMRRSWVSSASMPAATRWRKY